MVGELVDSVEPEPMGTQRFGNKAFRRFAAIFEDAICSIFHKAEMHGLCDFQRDELAKYLLRAFGDPTRLDYGSGHELAFLSFLTAFDAIRPFDQEEIRLVGLLVFPRNPTNFRRLPKLLYKLEPAGSHGVWGLDDYQFLPFLWGSSQLFDNDSISPADAVDPEVAKANAHAYMYLSTIAFIYNNKGLRFAEHSPMLYDISGIPDWRRVNQGLIKMYKGEVLSKFPVVQHMPWSVALRLITEAEAQGPFADAIVWEAGQPQTIETVEVAPPKAGEARVRIIASGFCHTDAYTHSGRDPEGVFPTILGHEGAGIVESIGEGVKSLKPGDHVIPLYVPECGSCKICKSGKTNLCSVVRETQGRGVMPDGTTRFTCRGTPIYHYMGCSTFSEYTVVLEISLAKIDPGARLDRVCLLGCAIPAGFGAVYNTANIEPASTVAVFGLGAVGLSVIMGAAKKGASRIIAIDINPAKFDLARLFGATDVINPKDYPDTPMHKLLIEMTEGGLDYTFECIGNVQTMREALEACHKGWGQSIIIGVAPSGAEISTRPFQLVTGRTWKGSAFGGVKGRSQLPKMVQDYMKGELEIDKCTVYMMTPSNGLVVTHTLKLEDINDAPKHMQEGSCIRCVIRLDKD